MRNNLYLKLQHRRATSEDLAEIISMLADDTLGKTRESATQSVSTEYLDAFKRIDSDPNHYLMVVDYEDALVATCHLTLLPSLTFTGKTRLQIEAVRVSALLRGHKVGEWMINQAIAYGQNHGATIIQLTTNKQRDQAIRFYEKLGFEATHEGMKCYI